MQQSSSSTKMFKVHGLIVNRKRKHKELLTTVLQNSYSKAYLQIESFYWNSATLLKNNYITNNWSLLIIYDLLSIPLSHQNMFGRECDDLIKIKDSQVYWRSKSAYMEYPIFVQPRTKRRPLKYIESALNRHDYNIFEILGESEERQILKIK